MKNSDNSKSKGYKNLKHDKIILYLKKEETKKNKDIVSLKIKVTKKDDKESENNKNKLNTKREQIKEEKEIKYNKNIKAEEIERYFKFTNRI